jgi:hypothetical protein
MSIDLPAFHAGTLMAKVRPKLFKLGWKQMDNGRMDCIEKIFGEYIVQTIWAGDQLMLAAHKVDGERDQYGNRTDWVPYDHTVYQQAIKEIQPIFDRTVKRNKKQWLKEVEEYEKQRRAETNNPSFKFPKNVRYGV